jgi:hypothetical protein
MIRFMTLAMLVFVSVLSLTAHAANKNKTYAVEIIILDGPVKVYYENGPKLMKMAVFSFKHEFPKGDSLLKILNADGYRPADLTEMRWFAKIPKRETYTNVIALAGKKEGQNGVIMYPYIDFSKKTEYYQVNYTYLSANPTWQYLVVMEVDDKETTVTARP